MTAACIDKAGDPLTKINETIDWELFRPALERARMKEKKTNAGAKGFDVVLQSLYNLSDESIEFQILDRYSFSRFLEFHAASKVPRHDHLAIPGRSGQSRYG